MKARHEFETRNEYTEYLRIYFAAMAMQGILAQTPRRVRIGEIVSESVTCADFLIRELNKDSI